MKKSLLFVFTMLLLACSHKNEIPPTVFPLNTMKMMVWDMEVAEQTAAEKFTMQHDSLRMDATSLYQQVFAKYKTDKATFYKSMNFYETHPETLRDLLDSVSSYGSRQRNEAYKKVY